jgi:hypothetical protein
MVWMVDNLVNSIIPIRYEIIPTHSKLYRVCVVISKK